MNTNQFMSELRGMFYHRPNKLALRRSFEERTWQKMETFHDYVHEKTILANRVPVNNELMAYIVDGIPDAALRDLARVHGFETVDSVLEAFEEITRGRVSSTSKTGDKVNGSNCKADKRDDVGKKSTWYEKRKPIERKDRIGVKRCYNCGQKDHININCPMKDKGVKCFECKGYGHIAVKCPKKTVVTQSDCAAIQTKREKHHKLVLINGMPLQAKIDTGSDIIIMRADECIKLGLPGFTNKTISFRGVGSEIQTTLEFHADITVDGHSYSLLIRVFLTMYCDINC